MKQFDTKIRVTKCQRNVWFVKSRQGDFVRNVAFLIAVQNAKKSIGTKTIIKKYVK